VNVRLITATNRDLRQEVAAGRFREDLFYRLNTVTLKTPSLRERREDIPLLVGYFLERLAAGHKKRVSPETMRLLQTYAWPGNVRELRNTVERFVILTEGELIEPRHLPVDAFPLPGDAPGPMAREEEMSLKDVERRHIGKVLNAQQANKTRTARVLGITKSTLYSKIRAYGIGAGTP
jgi:DNA-binding NtrC family response regulator